MAGDIDHIAQLCRHRGITLDDAAAHAQDHRSWSRRDFMSVLLGASAGVALSLGDTPLFASARTSRDFSGFSPERRLILIQLIGGNDGLNTVVPVTNDIYYQLRPAIALPKSSTWSLSDTLGMHEATAPLRPLWDRGDMSIIQGVGYGDSTLSHFHAIDVWNAADPDLASNDRLTGWIGDALLAQHPGFISDQPEDPLAVRVGGPQPLLFQSTDARMGVAISTPAAFERLAQDGTIYDPDDTPDSVAGNELAFVRQAANDALSYGTRIFETAQAGANRVDYPDSKFAKMLAIVAQLIKGGLGTQIYMVHLGGFDTHGGQLERHQDLLDKLSSGLAAFFDDLAADDWAENTLALTFSEFGRRPAENGSLGTDHGTLAPMFAFGPPVQGGLVGLGPDLENLDVRGNAQPTTDFRSIYSTVLHNWMGLPTSDTSAILGGTWDGLPFLSLQSELSFASKTTVESELLNFPNPFSSDTQIQFSVSEAGPVRLSLFDMSGRRLGHVVDQSMSAGTHTIRFTARDLPSGSYILRLDASGSRVQTRRITLTR